MAAVKSKKGGKPKRPPKKGKVAKRAPRPARKPSRPSKLVKSPARRRAPPKSVLPRAAAKKTASVPGPEARPPRAAPAAVRPQKSSPAKPRRQRTRATHGSGLPAAWFRQPNERSRPSSFIPAPRRAEAPSNVAAPPASSDRIVRPADMIEMAIRTFPVRVDLEQGGGRTRVHVFPEVVSIRAGDGLEWDFRYLGGADAIVEEILVEFDKPSPFSKPRFRTKNPGSARPHRQLSGPAVSSASGRTFRYTIRCLNLVKTEVALFQPTLIVAEN